MSKQSRGRPALDSAERIKRKASRDYRSLLEARKLTEEDLYANRLGDKKRGRAPVPIKEQICRAKKQFLISLDEYLHEFDEQKTNLSSIKELLRFFMRYRARDKAGRDAADEIIRLKQYIAKKERDLADLENRDEPVYSGKGPRPASNAVLHSGYLNEIQAAKKEMHKALGNKSMSEKLKYEIHDLKVERRRLNVKKNNNQINDVDYSRLFRDLDTKIDQLEFKKLNYESEEQDEKALEEMNILPNSNVNSNNDNLQLDTDLLKKIKSQKNNITQNREILIEVEKYLSNLNNLINLKEQRLLIEKEMIELKIILNT